MGKIFLSISLLAAASGAKAQAGDCRMEQGLKVCDDQSTGVRMECRQTAMGYDDCRSTRIPGWRPVYQESSYGKNEGKSAGSIIRDSIK